MANQLATAIEKARLVEELQARVEENQRLFLEAQNNLREIEELNRRLTRESWQEYLRARRSQRISGYTLHHGQVEPADDWSGAMRQAYQSEHSVVIQQDQQAHIAAVPLRVRGEVIGVLEIERGGERPWNDAEIGMAEALVERLAFAIENARLYEQATLAVERAHIVNEITQEIQRAETVDEILQAALAELGTVLGAARGVIQINPKVAGGPDGDRDPVSDRGG
jgi:GAF domain-containing protein